MTEPIDNTTNHIDTRDVQERINYLTGRGDEMDGAEIEELKALLELKKEYVTYFNGWEDGAQLIRESYFGKYAQELAEECGMINTNTSWPNNHIDWGSAANELLYDYSDITFDGVDYHTRGA